MAAAAQATINPAKEELRLDLASSAQEVSADRAVLAVPEAQAAPEDRVEPGDRVEQVLEARVARGAQAVPELPVPRWLCRQLSGRG